MRFIAKAPLALIGLAAVALTTSVADARPVHTKHYGGARVSIPAGARASVPAAYPVPHGSSSVPYAPETSPYPSGHGGKTGSPDFQLVG